MSSGMCVWRPQAAEEVGEAADVLCQAIKAPNATVTYLQASTTVQYQSGTLAFLSCPLGKVASGSATSTCRNGVWYPQIGVCENMFPDSDVRCASVTSVANGQVAYLQRSLFDQNVAGTVAVLICGLGYKASGPTTAKCTTVGTWENLGTCERWDKMAQITCPDIIAANGKQCTVVHDLLRPRKAGTASVLICNFGFTRVSTPIVTCMPNGQWSSDIGKCEYAFSTKQCSALSVADGIVIHDVLRPRFQGTAAILFCKTGFLSSGNTIVFCQPNGQWSAKLGECIPNTMSDECPPLTAVNGIIAYDLFRPRQVCTAATLICNAGFVTNGIHSVTCRSDGTWNGMNNE
uniref:Sushi domain-containing protein n=1 Tax=Ascaris lumbricoides TaxID=6252 RepID=A0A9J2P0M7_ASCLU